MIRVTALVVAALLGSSSATMAASTQPVDIAGRVFQPFHVESRARVLFFLSAECPISRTYAPQIQAMCSSYSRRGVSCALVFEDTHLSPTEVRKHLEEFGYRGLLAALDVRAAIARQMGATITPQAVVLDPHATIRYRGRIDNLYADLGKLRRLATVRDLRDALDALLANRPVAHPETQAVGCYITG
jgi:AhpC/TSA family protein